MSRQNHAEWRRWGVFNLVGILGFVLQMGVLLLLKRCFGVGYLIATFLAVEITVLHNFVWHEHLTWVDVVAPFRRGVCVRLMRFQVANGIISIAGNVAITWVLVESLRAPYLLANAASVLICAVLNFIAADRFVFRSECRGAIRPCMAEVVTGNR